MGEILDVSHKLTYVSKYVADEIEFIVKIKNNTKERKCYYVDLYKGTKHIDREPGLKSVKVDAGQRTTLVVKSSWDNWNFSDVKNDLLRFKLKENGISWGVCQLTGYKTCYTYGYRKHMDEKDELISGSDIIKDFKEDLTKVNEEAFDVILTKAAKLASKATGLSYLTCKQAIKNFGLEDLKQYLSSGTGAVYDWIQKQLFKDSSQQEEDEDYYYDYDDGESFEDEEEAAEEEPDYNMYIIVGAIILSIIVIFIMRKQ